MKPPPQPNPTRTTQTSQLFQQLHLNHNPSGAIRLLLQDCSITHVSFQLPFNPWSTSIYINVVPDQLVGLGQARPRWKKESGRIWWPINRSLFETLFNDYPPHEPLQSELRDRMSRERETSLMAVLARCLSSAAARRALSDGWDDFML